MGTGLVDEIMEQVRQIYEPEFSINSNSRISKHVAEKIKRYSENMFNGYNGIFSPDKMFCTKDCDRFDDKILVNNGGIVYGPYFDFVPGDYYAVFSVQTDGICTVVLEISSQTAGVINKIQISSGGRHILNFLVKEKLNDVEFKVVNNGKDAIIFDGVQIVDHDPNMIELNAMPFNSVNKNAADKRQFNFDEDVYMNVGEHNSFLVSKLIWAQNAANCDIPVGVRFRRLKSIIRKIQNNYICFQVLFNNEIVQIIRTVNDKLDSLINMFKKVWDNVQKHDELLKHLEQQKNTAEKEIKNLKEEVGKINVMIYKQMNAHDKSAKDIENLKQKVDNIVSVTNSPTRDKQIADIWQQFQEYRAALEKIDKSIQNHNEQFGNIWISNQNYNKEFSSLWETLKTINKEFEAIWESNRNYNKEFSSLWDNHRQLRQEVFYEIDYRTRAIGSSKTEPEFVLSEPVIKDSAMQILQDKDAKVRLNLGSGNLKVDGYLSVDARELSNVDIIAEVHKLPFKEDSIDEIFSAHLIEHFEKLVFEKELLPYWYSLLKEGGKFRVIFPDAEAMIDDYKTGGMSFDMLASVIMGGQDYALDYHYTMYNSERVRNILAAAGFHDIEVVVCGRQNGDCKETEIIAYK